MDEIREDLKDNTEKVVQRWESLTADRPWSGLPRDWRIDHLPDVIEGLADTALQRPLAQSDVRERLKAIARHGEERRKQGLEEGHILREYHYLRVAISEYLQDRWGRQEEVIGALLRIDAAITLATGASLLGYHRTELDARDGWEGSLDRLFGDSPLL